MSITISTMVLDSDCTCTYYDDADELVQSTDCYGCWDDNLAYFKDEFLTQWMAAHNLTDDSFIRIDGFGMGWMRQNGSTEVRVAAIVDVLRLNGEFRLSFTFDGLVLRGTRYSHDEPTGATFVFLPN